MARRAPTGPVSDLADDRPQDSDPADDTLPVTDAGPAPDTDVMSIGMCLATGPMRQPISVAGADHVLEPGAGTIDQTAAPTLNDQTPVPRQVTVAGSTLADRAIGATTSDDPTDVAPQMPESPGEGTTALGRGHAPFPDGSIGSAQSDDDSSAAVAAEGRVLTGKSGAQSPGNPGALAVGAMPTGQDTQGETPTATPVAVQQNDRGAVGGTSASTTNTLSRSGATIAGSPDIGAFAATEGASRTLPGNANSGDRDPASEGKDPPTVAPQAHPNHTRGNLPKDMADPLATGVAGPLLPHAAAKPEGTTPMASVQRSLPPGIAHQLAVNISHHPGRAVEITLSPDELGKVRMTVSAADGTLTLTLTADRGDTLDLLRRHIDQLAQDFRDLGFDRLTFDFAQDRNDKAPDANGEDQPTKGDVGHPSVPAPGPTPRSQPATLSGGLDLRL